MPQPLNPETNLLCPKGLAKRQGLVTFIGNQGITPSEDVGTTESRASLILRHDDGVIREVFNARCGDLNLLDAAARETELGKRNALLRLIFRLYRAGMNQTPVEVRREIRASEVEAVIAAIRRLSFMGNPKWEELLTYCEQCTAADTDVLAHVMDPFQLRHILTFHSESTRQQIGTETLGTLMTVAQGSDASAVRIWFQDLIRANEFLPKDTPQVFRAVLFELWKHGQGNLGALAFEIAVLDVMLFDDLGWESTRAFCTQLRRITGPGCETLSAYLTDQDVDDALTISEELRQEDLVVHFRKLATTYTTKQHRDLRKRVLVAAGKMTELEASTPPIPVPAPTPKQPITGSRPPSAWGNRPSGWSSAAG